MTTRKEWDSYFDQDQLAQGNQVLANNLRIKDAPRLEQWEALFARDRLQELEQQPIQGNFNYDHLKKIHRHIFQDTYAWAGETRTVGLAKGDSKFEPRESIEAGFEKLHQRLEKSDFLRGMHKEAIVGAVTDTFIEANRLHPFREGNGRATRAWLGQLTEQAGYTLNQKGIDEVKGYWNTANAKAMKGDKAELQAIFYKALRPSRSVAFEKLSEKEALEKFPELKHAYKEFEGMRKRVAEMYPDKPRTQATYERLSKDEVIGILDVGRIKFGSGHDHLTPHQVAEMEKQGEKQFKENLAVLIKDPRFDNHTPKEMANAAYWRGIQRQSDEGIGLAFDAPNYDRLLSNRKNAAMLPEPDEIGKLEKLAVKQMSRGKSNDGELSL